LQTATRPMLRREKREAAGKLYRSKYHLKG